MSDPRSERQADAYAARLCAEGVTDLSDDGILTALSECVRPARPHEVPAIRDAYIANYGPPMLPFEDAS